jgi:2-polyprenyl-6-methoxyphenol hydroxylase-like FAD-dependent oxidoreductase
MRVLVVGAGVGGLCAARALTASGADVTVFERVDSLERIQVGGAIHIWHNGMRGLQRLGLAEQVEQVGGRAAVVERAEMRNWRGRLITSWSPKQVEEEVGAPTIGIVRPELHRVLVGGLEDGVLRLGRECVGFDHDGGVVARFADGAEERGDVLIGADGLRSTVRSQLLGEEAPRYAGYASCQGIAEYSDEATPAGLFRIVWGPGARFLFYRLDNERLYWEGIFATEAGGGDPGGRHKQTVLERFAGWDHPVEPILAATGEDSIWRADAYDRPPTKRWGERAVTLLGDAAHAMTNAAGQGANQTIEDAVVLDRCLAGASDPEAALRAYEGKRIKRANGVNKLAWNLSRLSRWRNPAACALRDNMLTVMFALVAKRAQRKDMAYDFD